MLYIHIGMPKSGISALQGYLTKHVDWLEEQGACYLRAGREDPKRRVPLPSHNYLAKMTERDWGNDPRLRNDILQEQDANRDKATVISAEMLFNRPLKALDNGLLSKVDSEKRIVLYVRDFVEYLEADYKQKTKKGKLNVSAQEYTSEMLARAANDPEFLNFGALARRIRSEVPSAEFHPRIYTRSDLVGGNIILDFLEMLGVPTDTAPEPEQYTNKSLSRVASEALGIFARLDKRLNRRDQRLLDVALQNDAKNRFVKKKDVFSPEQARKLKEDLEQRNEEFREEYFPDRQSLFGSPRAEDPPEPEDSMKDATQFRQCTEFIMRRIQG